MDGPQLAPRRILKWPQDPYKGLNYFLTADAPLFGQREEETEEVAVLLTNFDLRALLLHGGTGTGKSSFLRAGLIPHLHKMSAEYGRNFFFLREVLDNGALGDPQLIRTTNDPIARIFEALQTAMQGQSISESAREAMRRALPDSLPRDRLKAVPFILEALKALTAPPQRDMLVLLIDQAEEVLTLPTPDSVDNARDAIFELLEKICVGLLDLRVIVALRTEYYGRFCSSFRIRPTNSLTPSTEARAGLMDYWLRPLSERDIAAAIRQPTLDEDKARDDGLPQPRSVYRFTYKGNLPEIIAADLTHHSGEASTLPAMQIVCKQLYESVILNGKMTEITEPDYVRFGRAAGAIDSFLVRALRDAATAAHLAPLGDDEVDAWALTLSRVVGRAEGGTIQTLIASEQDLVERAKKQRITSDSAHAMLNQMVHTDRRLLRLVAGEGGTSAYSLGHDSLGPSLLRRINQATARAEAKRYRKRLTRAVAGLVVMALVATAGLAASKILPLQGTVTTLTNYSISEPSPDFRLRLLLLSAALRSSDSWLGSWFINREHIKEETRKVLLRSPVYGGAFIAVAWDKNGQRVVHLEDDKLVMYNLRTATESQAAELPVFGLKGAPPPPFSVGVITAKDGNDALVAFRSDNGELLIGKEGSPLEPQFRFPEDLLKGGIFIPRADIFGDHARIILMHFGRSAINRMDVVRLSAPIDPSVTLNNLDDAKLQWRPAEQHANRQPILAEDCDTYAYLGRAEAKNPGESEANDKNKSKLMLWLEQLGKNETDPVFLQEETLPVQNDTGAVAIARGCDMAFVRDLGRTLFAVPLHPVQGHSETHSIPLTLPDAIAAMVVPSFPQGQPPFAAAPLEGGRDWRVGWTTTRGLALVDVKEGEASIPVPDNGQMLTGVESISGSSSLSFSPDGLFALLIRQQGFSSLTQLRAFNLDFGKQLVAISKLKSTADLVGEACRVAKFQNGSNQLSSDEMFTWLGRRNAPQPCTSAK
jgi:hypothetical protein